MKDRGFHDSTCPQSATKKRRKSDMKYATEIEDKLAEESLLFEKGCKTVLYEETAVGFVLYRIRIQLSDRGRAS
jgi:hypothetical protein